MNVSSLGTSCSKNGGETISQMFVFEQLVPDEIGKQRIVINEELTKHGLTPLDPHMNNLVVRDGVLTMIDCEVIVNLRDMVAFQEGVSDHTYTFPIEYYKLILQELF